MRPRATSGCASRFMRLESVSKYPWTGLPPGYPAERGRLKAPDAGSDEGQDAGKPGRGADVLVFVRRRPESGATVSRKSRRGQEPLRLSRRACRLLAAVE